MNTSLKIFNYRFQLVEFLFIFFCYLLMENIFSWLVMPKSVIVLAYEKILSILLFFFMMYSFFKLKRTEQIYMGIFTLIMIRLIFESLFTFGSPFQQFTMYTVLFPVIYTLFIKYISRTYDLDLLEFLAKFYLFTYIIFMGLYGRGFSFSLAEVVMDDYGPFSGDSRIIHARSIFMMIIPFLWFLHSYIHSKKLIHLLPVLFCLVVILVHQHRSVWSCTIFSLLIYLGLTIRLNIKTLPRIWSIGFGALVLLCIAYFLISSLVPGIIDFFYDRFSEIFNPAKEDSTGRFRVEQREVYFKMFLERPIFGWTFEGFEMPNPMVDWWPEKTGQHFHEGYIEMLFYHGIVGLVIKYSFLVYLIIKAFSKKITEQSIILISFGISGLLFSFNYVLPNIFWGHIGLCLYYIEKDALNFSMANKIKQEDNVEVQGLTSVQLHT